MTAKVTRESRSGDKLTIVDVRHTHAYARQLEACGLKNTGHRSLGGIWSAARLVTAIKP